MKTATQCRAEIKALQEKMGGGSAARLSNREYNAAKRRAEYLGGILLYLLTNPNEAFCLSEQQRLKRIIAVKSAGYTYWAEKVCPQDVPLKKRKALYNKETGLTVLRRQLATLNYICS